MIESKKNCTYGLNSGFSFDPLEPREKSRNESKALPVHEFLNFSKSRGNDLTIDNPMYNFKGLKEGDKWCLCVSRWVEAYEAGCPPNLIFEATNIKTLDYVSFDKLLEFKA